MSSSKQPLIWGLSVGLLVVIGVWMAVPLEAIGGPPLRITATPPSQVDAPTRPPINPTPTPIPGAEPSSPSGADTTWRKIDLALIVDKMQARPGDSLNYQLQVSNVAGQKATNVWLTCDLPDEVEIVTYSTTRGTVHRYGQRLSVEMGLFEPSYESFWVEIEARIKDEVTPGARLIHQANLTSDQAGGGERDAATSYGLQVETLVLAGGAEKTPLPSTGRSALSVWVVLGFAALIAAAAFLESRRQDRLPD